MSNDVVYGRKTYGLRLQEAGLDMDSADFEKIVRAVWRKLFADLTDEQILSRPFACACPLIEEVRRRVKKPDLDESLITGHLLKPRKNGRRAVKATA